MKFLKRWGTWRRRWLRRPLWVALLLTGSLGGAVCGCGYALSLVLIFMVPTAMNAQGNGGTGLIVVGPFALAVGLILGAIVGLASSAGAVVFSLPFLSGSRPRAGLFVTVALGAIGGAVAACFLFAAPDLAWDPVVLAVFSAVPAASGLCWVVYEKGKGTGENESDENVASTSFATKTGQGRSVNLG
jgi:hypothetical protein